MDPITCTYNTTRQNQYKAQGGNRKAPAAFCWLDMATADDDDGDDGDSSGGYFFPLIQTWDSDCMQCNKDGRKNKYCQKAVDLEFLLYFSADEPAEPFYTRYNFTSFYHYGTDTSTAAGGFDGLVYMNLVRIFISDLEAPSRLTVLASRFLRSNSTME